MQEGAFCAVAGKCLERGVIAKAEFADVNSVGFGEVVRIGREIPGFHFEGAHLDVLEIADTGNFGLVLRHATPCAELFDFFFSRVGDIGLRAGSFGRGGSILDIDEFELGVFVFGRAGSDLGSDDGY